MAQPRDSTTLARPSSAILKRPEVGALVAAIVVFVFFAVTTDTFATAERCQHLAPVRPRRSASWPSPSPC